MTRQELQDKKNAAAEAVKTYHSEHDKSWNAEHEANWVRLNAEHDAAAKALTDYIEGERAAAERALTLKRIEDGQKQVNGDKGGGFDGDKRRELDPEHQVAKTQADFDFTVRCCIAGVDIDDTEKRQKFAELRNKFGIKKCSNDNGSGSQGYEFPFGFRQYGDPAWTCGGVPMRREVRVGLDVATSGAAKETIPQGFMAALEYKTLAYGHVRQVARVINTPTGNSMPWPVVDDTSNVAAILAEATTISTSVDPTFSAITFLAYKLSSKPVFCSNEILQDSAFNLGAEIGGMIGERFGRGENVYFTTGTNSSQPQGCVAAAGTGVTSASATAFTADELLGLIHSLDPSYRALPSTGFMMHDSVLLYVRKFKDANGQYLWQPGMQAGVADRLAGYPVAVNQQMTGTTSGLPVTGTKHVLFGAFEKYVIRDCGGVRLYHLTERYRDTDQDAFIAFKRIDGRALNTAALKVLLQA